MQSIFDFIFHLDTHLAALVASLGSWSYAVLFLVVFCETGLVFIPFLPGDSLIFVAATLAGQDLLRLDVLFVIFAVAGIAGDAVNYWVGSRFGKALERGQWLKQEHLEKTQSFYAKYGKKTIVIARFIPIVRTFAPFVAGVGHMHYRDFALYNVAGGVLWAGSLSVAGYFFGQVPWVQHNLEKVIVGIIVLSLIPPAVEWLRQGKKQRQS